jgi:hypothetical protein
MFFKTYRLLKRSVPMLPPPIPPMVAAQALQLLHLHHKTVRLGWRVPHLRRRKGESEAVFAERLGAVWRGGKALDGEDEALARAARDEKSGTGGLRGKRRRFRFCRCTW